MLKRGVWMLCRILLLGLAGSIVAWEHGKVVLIAPHYARKDVLYVCSEVYLVHFAAFKEGIHESQILGGIVTAGVHPVASAHGYVTEASLYGYVVYLYDSVLQELLE